MRIAVVLLVLLAQAASPIASEAKMGTAAVRRKTRMPFLHPVVAHSFS